ncbi:hypothetical protein SSS_09844 [Sarcoptes scabiei]|uniref:Uncharacterized protein n=1 Tax=Sarcoptes scabiei TaxID=52283 RepID=A0A834VGS4_SARSC|nr:hypothetical protein SSS_09844 [Sarcoptes scabiei]
MNSIQSRAMSCTNSSSSSLFSSISRSPESIQKSPPSPRNYSEDFLLTPYSISRSDDQNHILLVDVKKNLFHFFSCESIDSMQMQLNRLDMIWKQMNLSPDEQQNRIASLENYLLKSLNSFIENEEIEFDESKKEIAILEKEIETLLEILSDYKSNDELSGILRTYPQNDINNDSHCKFDELTTLLNELKDYHEKLLAVVKQKQKSFLDILERLNEDPNKFEKLLRYPLLNTDELDYLTKKIDEFEGILIQRENISKNLAKKIKFLIKIVPIHPINDRFLLNSIDFQNQDQNFLHELFVLSEKNVESLRKHLDRIIELFKSKLTTIRIELNDLKKIYLLFEKTFENSDQRFDIIQSILDEINDEDLDLDHFIDRWKESNISLNLSEIIQSISNEYDLYNRLKQNEMQSIIQRIRKIFEDLCEQCFIEFHNLKFKPLFEFLTEENLDEECLEKHEMMLEHLQNYQNKYREIFDLISKRIQLDQESVELEEQSQNVYKQKNRGGIIQKILNRKRFIERSLKQIKQQIRIWCEKKLPELRQNPNLGEFEMIVFNIDNLIAKFAE